MGQRGVEREVDQRVQAFSQKVRARYTVDRIILFGSRARGDHLLDSDYDFIVVSDDFQGTPFYWRMVPLYELWDDWSVPMEVLCYTREEFARKAAQISIVAEAVREGIQL